MDLEAWPTLKGLMQSILLGFLQLSRWYFSDV